MIKLKLPEHKESKEEIARAGFTTRKWELAAVKLASRYLALITQLASCL